MKVIIAYYACLLLLHILTENCYDNLKTIIIYSHLVAVRKIQNNEGIFSNEQFYIEGQSSNDTVVIIWNEAKSEAYHPRHSSELYNELKNFYKIDTTKLVI